MLRFHLIFIGLTVASCQGFLWYQGDSRDASESTTPSSSSQASPRMQTYPITYIRAFAYHPVAFPQPLATITAFNMRNSPQPQNSGFQTSRGGGFAPNYQKIDTPSAYALPNYQQLPQNHQSDFGTVPTTTSTTTTTTTPAPTTTTTTTTPPPPQTSFVPSQQAPVSGGMNTRSGAEGYQRQLYYGGANYGGYPTFYNNPYNPYPYVDQSVGNQFTGRYSSGEPAYQQYTTDSVTYQFIPTSITPIQQQQQAPVQNNVKFVPCMCPVAVSMSPPIPEKRSDEIPTGPVASQPSQSLVSETEGQPISSSMKTLDEIELEESK